MTRLSHYNIKYYKLPNIYKKLNYLLEFFHRSDIVYTGKIQRPGYFSSSGIMLQTDVHSDTRIQDVPYYKLSSLVSSHEILMIEIEFRTVEPERGQTREKPPKNAGRKRIFAGRAHRKTVIEQKKYLFQGFHLLQINQKRLPMRCHLVLMCRRSQGPVWMARPLSGSSHQR